MRQKFTVAKSAANEIIVREYSELDKDEMSILCEAKFSGAVIADAMNKGPEDLITVLRSDSLFPPRPYIEKIAAAVVQLFQDSAENPEPVEILLEDKENLESRLGELDDIDDLKEAFKEDLDEDDDDIDNLLKDDTKIDSSMTLKVADSDSLETEAPD